MDAVGSLAAYAAKRAGRLAELLPRGAVDFDDQAMADIVDWIWDGHTDIIADYVADNPADLPDTLLREVARWQDAGLESEFPITCHQGDSIFLSDQYALLVCGITQEPYELVSEVPAYVHGVLVPFEGKIAYVHALGEMPISIGDTMRKMIESEIEEDRKAGRFLATADGYLQALPDIRAAKEKGKQDAERNAEFQKNGPSQAYLDGFESMPDGYHRGHLADLPWEERERLVEQRMKSDLAKRLLPLLEKNHAFKGPAVQDLAGLLNKRNKEALKDLAWRIDLDGVSKLRKTDLVDAVAEGFMEYPDIYVQTEMSEMESATLHCVKETLDAGGRLVMGDSEWAVGALVAAAPDSLLPTFFLEGEDLVAVVPDELLDALRELDWDDLLAEADRKLEEDQAIAKAKRTVGFADYAEKLVWLRGIVPLRTFAREYKGFARSLGAEAVRGFTDDIAIRAIVSAWENDPMAYDFEIIQTGREGYLVMRELADLNWEEVTGAKAKTTAGYAPGYPGAQIGRYLRDILSRQAAYPARPMPEELLEADAYLDWALQQPQMQTLTKYLDAHVPDGEDEITYVENAIAFVCDASHGAYPVMDLMQDLGDFGLYGDEQSLNAVMWLVQNVLNHMPNWEDNGWSPAEAHEMSVKKGIRSERRERKPRPRKKSRKR